MIHTKCSVWDLEMVPIGTEQEENGPCSKQSSGDCITTEHRTQSMKFTVMELYPCSYVLDNVIITLFGCIVRTNRGRELQSSEHAFLLPAPNHTGSLQHTKSQKSPSEVNNPDVRRREPTVRLDS